MSNKHLPSPAHLRKLGHAPLKPIQALRARCIDCCGGSPKEVKLCACKKCPSWPFRLGEDPWKKKRPISEGQRVALEQGRKKRLEKTNEKFRRD